MKPAINRFEPFEGVEQLQSGLPHWIGPWAELFGVLDGEPYPVDGDASLICHFEFNR